MVTDSDDMDSEDREETGKELFQCFYKSSLNDEFERLLPSGTLCIQILTSPAFVGAT